MRSNVSVLQAQGRSNANGDSNYQACEEDSQENSDTFYQADEAKRTCITTFFISLSCLEQHNGDGIIQDWFAEDDRV